MWGFDGVGHTPTETGLPFHGEAAMVDDTYIVGRIGLSKSIRLSNISDSLKH